MVDTSIKVSKEGMMIINELQHQIYKEEDRIISKKQIVEASLKHISEHKTSILKTLKPAEKDRAKAIERFLSGKKYDLGKNWMEEIDTTF